MRKVTYEEILKATPSLGKVKYGEVELTPDRLGSETLGPTGILYQDRYVTLVRDHVTFPNYTSGGHVRLLEGDPTNPRVGVVILAMRPNADDSFDVAWVRQYRHTLSGWETALPRGSMHSGESPAEAALRELSEETGLTQPGLMVHLGEMSANSGISGTIINYYAAVYLGHHRVVQRGKNETEAISNVIWAPYEEWRKVIAVPGSPGRPVAPIDQFTLATFGLAHMTGYLSRIQESWKDMYRSAFANDPRVSARLARTLEDGADSFDARIRCRNARVVLHFLRELPSIKGGPVEGSPEVLAVERMNPLELAWFLATPLVESVE